MKYFVTGATGFIGQYLTRRLIEARGNTIYCLVRDEKKLPEDLRRRVKICEGDNSSLEKYSGVIQSCDVIFHVAARASLGNGEAYRRDNVEFTDTLIRIAQGSRRLKRFVFTSTIGALDRSKEDPCTAPLTEDSNPNPTSDYGRSKLACEVSLAASTLPYVIVRPVLVYGPGMRRLSHLRVFIDAVENGKVFSRFNFPGKLSFIHVNDLVDALLLVAKHPKAVRQTFFAADDTPVSLGAVFRHLGAIFGKNAGDIEIGFGLPQLLRSGRKFLPLQAQSLFSDILTASNAKLRALGFVPTQSQSAGFLETSHYHYIKGKAEQKNAIVTGGAGGIGRELCRQLYAHGFSVVVVDRNDTQGQEVADSVNGEFLHCDLANAQDLDRAVRYLQKNAGSISLLVNNAGIGKRGNTEEIPASELADVIAINCLAPVTLVNAILPTFLKQGYGTVVNIGSSAGYQPLPYMSVYAASKAFIIRYTQAVRGELKGRGIPSSVEMILVSPSGTATGFQKASGVKNEDASKLLLPEEVAAAIIRQIGRGSAEIIVGSSGKAMALAGRVLPTSLQIQLWERLMNSMR